MADSSTTKSDPDDGSGSSKPKVGEMKPPAQPRTQLHIRSFMSVFTLERFKKNPDLYRKRIAAMIDDQIRHAEATTALLRYLGPELNQQERQLGFLNIKCRTIYERLCFIRQLRENADTIIGNFDLSNGKSVEDVVSEAPPLLKNAVRVYQTRWRNAIASSKWHKDLMKAQEELANVRERYENNERELESKRVQIEMYKKILAIKDELTGLNEEEKLKKIESTLGVNALRLPENSGTNGTNVSGVDLKRASSSSSVTSEDESNWDEFWESNAAMIDEVVAQGAHLLDENGRLKTSEMQLRPF